MKKALIFGVTGQDGSYLTDLLLEKGYDVVGVARRTSTSNTSRIKHVLGHERFKLVNGDVTDALCVHRLVTENDPWRFRSKNGEPPYVDLRYEIYNLAAQSHVGVSFEEPSHTTQATYLGCLNILESIRTAYLPKYTRFYQASSSEMFGSSYSHNPFSLFTGDSYPHIHTDGVQVKNVEFLEKADFKLCGSSIWKGNDCYVPPDPNKIGVQAEYTQMLPNSPYAIAKLAAHHACRVYREAYRIFACSGILFNHESERRGLQFVTRKIARYAARFGLKYNQIADCWNADQFLALNPALQLGNLDARRDWGHAEDYVRGMWMMLQQESPDDYVLATGETHSVREFLEAAFQEMGVPAPVMEQVLRIDKGLMRPSEVPFLRGDAGKAKRVMGWEPTIRFAELVKRMVLYEVQTANSTEGE